MMEKGMTNTYTEEDIADRLDTFDEIKLQHPRLADVERYTNALLTQTSRRVAKSEARAAEANGRPIKFDELWVLPIIGPSGAMKTTSMDIVVDRIYRSKNIPETERPIIVVTMRGVKNTRAFQAAILEKLDPAQARELRENERNYHMDAVNEALRKKAAEWRTRLIVIDEAHSILTYDGGGIAKQMADCIKGLLNEGIFSLILMGTEAINGLFKNDELRNRKFMAADAHLARFKIESKADRDYFFGFIELFENRMVERKVVSRALNLTGSAEDRALIYEMSDGILGVVHKLLRASVDHALRHGRDYLELEDVKHSYRSRSDAEADPKKKYDPISDEIRKETLSHVLKDVRRASGKSKAA